MSRRPKAELKTDISGLCKWLENALKHRMQDK